MRLDGGRSFGRRRGIVTVEFSLITPLILLLLAGAVDFGRLVRISIAVADAARAGAQFGSLNLTNSTNTAGMQSAALNAGSDVPGLSVTSVRSCQCSGGTAVNCTGSCSGGKMLVYVSVTAQATCNPIFSYPGLPFAGTTSTTASMRAQ